MYVRTYVRTCVRMCVCMYVGRPYMYVCRSILFPLVPLGISLYGKVKANLAILNSQDVLLGERFSKKNRDN